MKIRTYIPVILGALALCSCSDEDKAVEFELDCNAFEIGAEGGERKIGIASQDGWTATTNEPWITVSPANGRGSVECRILVDSALTATPRQGVVRIQNEKNYTNKEITVKQSGFDYTIAIDDKEVSIENFATYGERYFDVKVKTNVDFEVEVPDAASNWLKYERYTVTDKLDRGIRPREITVRFNWDINSRPEDRIAQVAFTPKEPLTLVRQDGLKVTQGAAEAIPENTRKGDSIALLAIARSLQTWGGWDGADKMDNWNDVQLWEDGMPGYTPEKKGRVRYARFFMFTTKEGLPFEVQYLTAAEELQFYGNSNSYVLNLDTGEYITKLTQLKRLTIGAYGLTTLHPDFVNLKQLESLVLTGNNFEEVPAILTKENFPDLNCLDLIANQRSNIYDMSNTVKTDFGGLFKETSTGLKGEIKEFPRRLFEWNLDTLALSANFLQGELPPMDDYEKYTQADISAYPDSLPAKLIGIPKVMPAAKRFTINLNKLTGKLPDWLLYHPALNYWNPEILVFNQEGKDQTGRSAGFSNTPTSMDYYYDFYEGYKQRPDYDDEVEETPSGK